MREELEVVVHEKSLVATLPLASRYAETPLSTRRHFCVIQNMSLSDRSLLFNRHKVGHNVNKKGRLKRIQDRHQNPSSKQIYFVSEGVTYLSNIFVKGKYFLLYLGLYKCIVKIVKCYTLHIETNISKCNRQHRSSNMRYQGII